jgi:photosystem II stability/assembly factor-like uncharacterized protein
MLAIRRMGLMGKMRTIRLMGPIVFICLISPATATAQLRGSQGWIWQNPLPQGNPLTSIHFAKDKLSGFAVGADNTVLRTQDGGFSARRCRSISTWRGFSSKTKRRQSSLGRAEASL